MPNPTYIVFDVETTGLEPGSHIVEIAAQKVDGVTYEVVDQFCRLVDPCMPLPADAMSVNRLTAEDFTQAPSINIALREWLEFCEGSVFGVAHHSPYDEMIIAVELGRICLTPPVSPITDTCAIAKQIKATANNKLATLVGHYKIVAKTLHRALADVDACRQYYDIVSKSHPALCVSHQWHSDYTYPTAIPKAIESLPHLIARGEPFEFNYSDAKGNKSTRKIIPYGFAQKGDQVYFHGLDLEKQERRTFISDRITP